jgi:4-hydroxybenzoate polyprenyltransferase
MAVLLLIGSFSLPGNALLFSVLLTFFYSLPLLPLGVAVKLRKFGFVKTGLLAFAWAWVTVALPVAGAVIKLQLPVTALVFLQRFLFVFILCLIFDARDIESDTLAGIHSLATAYGTAIIRRILYGAAGTLFLFHCLMGPFVGSSQLLAMQATLLMTCVVCFLSTNRKGFLFYYVLVDGLMIFSASMCFLAAKYVNLH